MLDVCLRAAFAALRSARSSTLAMALAFAFLNERTAPAGSSVSVFVMRVSPA
jgi:hypothetical protein